MFMIVSVSTTNQQICSSIKHICQFVKQKCRICLPFSPPFSAGSPICCTEDGHHLVGFQGAVNDQSCTAWLISGSWGSPRIRRTNHTLDWPRIVIATKKPIYIGWANGDWHALTIMIPMFFRYHDLETQICCWSSPQINPTVGYVDSPREKTHL